MNDLMNATTTQDKLRIARKLVMFTAQGIAPSAKVASAADEALEQACDERDLDVGEARKLLRFIAQGVMPSQEKCHQAADQIDGAIEAVTQADGLRERFGRLR